jgi:branched-chain amino acid aminotransferase/4-amino-4-deoxychorismate lyase
MTDAIPLDDRGFTLGDGLFETLLVEDGAIRFWEAHVARLAGGCAALGLAAPDPAVLRSVADEALKGKSGRLALRVTVTAGSGGRGLDRPAAADLRIVATAAPAPSADGPLTLATAGVRRNDASPCSRLKTLSYLDNVLARAEARAAGADEAVMLNTRGEVACAAAGNLLWLVGGRLLTPALDCGVLDGITRRRALAAAAVLGLETAEVRAGPEALVSAEAVMVTNSLIGVRAASALDGRALAGHPLVGRIAEALRQG